MSYDLILITLLRTDAPVNGVYNLSKYKFAARCQIGSNAPLGPQGALGTWSYSITGNNYTDNTGGTFQGRYNPSSLDSPNGTFWEGPGYECFAVPNGSVNIKVEAVATINNPGATTRLRLDIYGYNFGRKPTESEVGSYMKKSPPSTGSLPSPAAHIVCNWDFSPGVFPYVYDPGVTINSSTLAVTGNRTGITCQ